MPYSSAQVLDLLHQHYGLQGQIKALVGYEDLNFRLRTEEGTLYVVKISRDPAALPLVQAQQMMLEHLEAGPLAAQLPRLLKSTEGQALVELEGGHSLRVLTFLEGTFLVEASRSPSLYENLGHFLGQMNLQLQGLDIPQIRIRELSWDLAEFPQSEAYFKHIQDPHRRRMVAYFFLQWEMEIAPRLSELRRSPIHNDANDWNVLVEGDQVCGLIDFGDCVYTQTVHELAIAIAYAAMKQADPLAVAMALTRGYHQAMSLEALELELLYFLVATRLCISVAHSAYNITQEPDNEYLLASEAGAWELLEKWLAINPHRAENALREACQLKPKPAADYAAFNQARHRHLSRALSVSYAPQPIKMERAALAYMYDDRGNTYLDGVNNICHVGHCHPRVVRAAQRQIARLNTNTRYYYDSLNQYAAELCALFPEPLKKVFFVNSGSAATDLALRLARNYTGRQDLIVVDQAYHGNTSTGIEVSPYKHDGPGGAGSPAFIHKALMPDPYRGAYREHQPETGQHYADSVRQLLIQAEAQGRAIAAFMCESILGCGGQIVLPPTYLSTVYAAVREAGGLCIADEVQTGFGRVGRHWWAFEMQGVVPDIVILGKPMGNGHPMGAVVCTEAVAASFENGMEFFSSFGGNPVSCEIGRAVLQVIREEGLREHASKLGEWLQTEWKYMQSAVPGMGDVRGTGLFWGVEWVKDPESRAPDAESASALVRQMKEKGILLSTDGPQHNVIKFKPPMVFSQSQAERLLMSWRECAKMLF